MKDEICFGLVLNSLYSNVHFAVWMFQCNIYITLLTVVLPC